MTALTTTALQALPIGTRLVFPKGADAYPDFCFVERLTGTLVRHEHEFSAVRLDLHKPELDDWQNEIHCWHWDDMPMHGVELL